MFHFHRRTEYEIHLQSHSPQKLHFLSFLLNIIPTSSEVTVKFKDYFQCCYILLFKLIVIDFNEVILKYIKIYYSSFFLTYLYIKKKLHSGKRSSIYTETYIFDTYIFGTDYIILWSVITKFRCCNLK